MTKGEAARSVLKIIDMARFTLDWVNSLEGREPTQGDVDSFLVQMRLMALQPVMPDSVHGEIFERPS
jgi:hypothetical protein